MEVKLQITQGYRDELQAELTDRDEIARISPITPIDTARLLDGGGWEVLSIVCSGLGFLLAVRAWLRERRSANPKIEIRVIVEGSSVVDLEALPPEAPNPGASALKQHEEEPRSDG